MTHMVYSPRTTSSWNGTRVAMKIALLAGAFFHSYLEISLGVLGNPVNDIGKGKVGSGEQANGDSPGLVYENDILRLDNQIFEHELSAASNASSGAPNGDTLFLLSVYEPNCKHSNSMINKMEVAAALLRSHISSHTGTGISSSEAAYEYGSSNNLRLHMSYVNEPILAKMDISGANKEKLQVHFDGINDATPLLKFILVRHKIGDEYNSDETTLQLHSLDYVGKDATVKDIFDTVVHYWYRLIVSERTEISAVGDILQSHDMIEETNDRMDLVPSKPIFTMPNLGTLKEFIRHQRYIFNASPQDFYGASIREEEYMRFLLRSSLDDGTDFVVEDFDCCSVFVQCRAPVSSAPGENEIDLAIHASFQEYDQLALLYIYRKDVAFFAIVADDCDWMPRKKKDEKSAELNGSVGILEISVHSSAYTGPPEYSFKWKNGSAAVYDISDKSRTDQNEDLKLDMTHFAIIQTTPTILWLDRYTTATMAFPIYRQVHFVLFVDVHTPRQKNGLFDYDSTASLQSLRAIALLRETAELHKEARPNDDVVFVVVPSTSTQIMTTFGMDIWTELDIKCSNMRENDPTSDCTGSIDSLPAAMITSRRESKSFMNTYYLSSEDVLREGSQNPLTEFLNDYFDRKLSPVIKSEPTTLEESYGAQNGSNVSLPSGVQILTARSFPGIFNGPESLKHTLVYFYTPTCGHCKRFDTIYHRLSRLIIKLGWESKISIMKVDISKNEIHFDGIDIRNVPAVYFFPIGRKEEPQELTIEGDSNEFHNVGGISDPVLIVAWILDVLGKDDLVDLRALN